MAASATRQVRIQDLEPGMKIARVNVDLDFVYLEVAKVVPQKVKGRTTSYQVYLVGYVPGSNQDTSIRPFVVRPTGSGSRLTVLTEQA